MSGVRSMTGFAAVDLEGKVAVRFTVKSVNHRYLDLSLRLPPGWEALEPRLRRLVKERVCRGHLELALSVERPAAMSHSISEAALASYAEALRSAAKRLGIQGEPDLATLTKLPGVVSTSPADGLNLQEWEAPVSRAVEGLLDRFNQVREEEGNALAAALKASLAELRLLLRRARGLRERVRDDHLKRLRARMRSLLPSEIAVPEGQLLSEAAVLAERSDVEEELTRASAHIESFSRTLDAGGELGKRLDFLLQEMNREVNTMLSKTGSAAGRDGLELTEVGLACKGEIERMREQVQNLE